MFSGNLSFLQNILELGFSPEIPTPIDWHLKIQNTHFGRIKFPPPILSPLHCTRSECLVVLSECLIVLSWVSRHPRRKFSTNLSLSGRIREVQNTTSCHHSGTMSLNPIRISTVRDHAPYKYPPRNTMQKCPGTNSNPLRILWSDTSFPPYGVSRWVNLWDTCVT